MNATFSRRRLANRAAAVFGTAGMAIATSCLAGTCTRTAELMLEACGHDGQDDMLSRKARCLQISRAGRRAECLAGSVEDLAEHESECVAQHAERLAVCAVLGEDRYDPDYTPALFDPDYANPVNPNPYYPLGIGNRWVYRGSGEERGIVEILDRTKHIRGLSCIVALDRVYRAGTLKERTDDWFCQAKNGDVHYLGEETGEYRVVPEDNPPLPELLDIDGSFKAGRELARGGVIFLGAPVVGAVYREEYALGDAEDIAEVISTSYRFGDDPALDTLVPQALADLLCAAGDCVVTLNTSQLEPGVSERKYYAQGIGMFLETAPDTGEVVQLVNCNFDARCESLPRP